MTKPQVIDKKDFIDISCSSSQVEIAIDYTEIDTVYEFLKKIIEQRDQR